MKNLKSILSSLFLYKAKKGAMDGKIATLIGALIFIVLVVALGPTMFTGLNNISNAPDWMNTVLPIVVGAGLLFAVFKAFD